jgi:hypothetical protein
MTKLLFIIGLLSTTFCFGQQPRENSLLIAEYQKNEEGMGNYTHLVSYNFIDGKLTSKDTVLSAPTSKGKHQGSYVRYDLGYNFVYKNRYVISGIGNVIDIQSKSLVMEESDDLIETRGDSIIFHRENIINGTGYLVCDIKNQTYGLVKDKHFMAVMGTNSPNHLWGLEIDKSELPYKIIRYDINNGREVLINNCGTGTLLSSYASTMPNVPVYWIDNQCFLYATYSTSEHRIEGIKATVTIHKFSLDTKDSEIVAEIASVPPALSTSNFSTDPEGKIIFYCAKGQFVIDIDEKKTVPYKMSSVDNDFSIENNSNDDYGRIIAFQGNEIGRVWCTYYNAKTTTEFIGVEYGDIGSNLGYPIGVKVWSSLTKTWTNIEIPWLSGFIGWIEK